ncbi:MAG: MBL fold metallo-hydrolase [Desulfatibacillaceae bacterium]
MGMPPFTRGAHEIMNGVFAYLQPDGSWGLSNAGLVISGNKGLVVDTLFDLPLTREMLRAYQDAAGPGLEYETLVCTHGNGDHTFGNQLLPDAEIVGSRHCGDDMSQSPPSMMVEMLNAAPQMGDLGKYFVHCFGSFDFSGIELRPPTRFVDGELSLDVGGREVRVIEVGPAHTRGDVIVHVPDARVVFAGDILFVGGMPVMWAGPMSNWLAACDRIVALEPEYVVPGHGPVTDVAGVMECRRVLEKIRDEAEKRYYDGYSARAAAVDMAKNVEWNLLDHERLVMAVHTLFREFGSEAEPAGVVDMFSEMAEIARDPGLE